jgi:hypothetical protein
MGPNGRELFAAHAMWLPGKASNLDSSRSERDVLPTYTTRDCLSGSLPRRFLLSVSYAERRCLAVTIRTKHAKILELMVVSDTVVVM